MNALIAALAVAVLLLVVLLGVAGASLEFVFGVIVPYAAVALFLLGFSYRILKWAGSAVPFRITTTCGQQKTLGFIKEDNLENPHTTRNRPSGFAKSSWRRESSPRVALSASTARRLRR